jgi:hypothetical protein
MASERVKAGSPPTSEQDALWLEQADSIWAAAIAKNERAAADARALEELQELQRRQYEKEIEAAANNALQADLGSLPVVESITAEQFLDLFGFDDEVRFDAADETVFDTDGMSLIEIVTHMYDPCGILSCGFCEAGVPPDTCSGTVLLARYSAEEARRYIAWARAADLDCADRIYWVKDEEIDRLEAMLPELEAKSLEKEAEKLEAEADREGDWIHAFGGKRPEDVVHRGLQHAVEGGRAGERMERELAQQLYMRDVLRDGREGVERKQDMATDLRRRAAALRSGLPAN